MVKAAADEASGSNVVITDSNGTVVPNVVDYPKEHNSEQNDAFSFQGFGLSDRSNSVRFTLPPSAVPASADTACREQA